MDSVDDIEIVDEETDGDGSEDDVVVTLILDSIETVDTLVFVVLYVSCAVVGSTLVSVVAGAGEVVMLGVSVLSVLPVSVLSVVSFDNEVAASDSVAAGGEFPD